MLPEAVEKAVRLPRKITRPVFCTAVRRGDASAQGMSRAESCPSHSHAGSSSVMEPFEVVLWANITEAGTLKSGFTPHRSQYAVRRNGAL